MLGYIRFLHIQCNRIFATVGKTGKSNGEIKVMKTAGCNYPWVEMEKTRKRRGTGRVTLQEVLTLQVSEP